MLRRHYKVKSFQQCHLPLPYINSRISTWCWHDSDATEKWWIIAIGPIPIPIIHVFTAGLHRSLTCWPIREQH